MTRNPFRAKAASTAHGCHRQMLALTSEKIWFPMAPNSLELFEKNALKILALGDKLRHDFSYVLLILHHDAIVLLSLHPTTPSETFNNLCYV